MDFDLINESAGKDLNARRLKTMAASSFLRFSLRCRRFHRRIPHGDKMRDSPRITGGANRSRINRRETVEEGAGKGLEIYANASVNKRNEARCINSCSMSGKGDSFCTVGPARKMSGRKPPFLRNLRRVRKRARRGEEGEGERARAEKKCARERERECRRLVTSLVLVKKVPPRMRLDRGTGMSV